MPVGEAPHKRIEPEPGREVRLEMARLAAATDPALEASDVETSREGPSFTFRTLELLSDARPNDELVFLMGADVAAGLESWRDPQRVLELARLGIAARPGNGAGRGGGRARAPGRQRAGRDREDARDRRLLDGHPPAGGGGAPDPPPRPRRGRRADRRARAVPGVSAVLDKGQDRLSSEALARRIAAVADAKQARGRRRARHAEPGRLHGLPGHLHGAQRAPGEGDPRGGLPAAEARRRPAAGDGRGRASRRAGC